MDRENDSDPLEAGSTRVSMTVENFPRTRFNLSDHVHGYGVVTTARGHCIA